MILEKNYVDEKERFETTSELLRKYKFLKKEIIGNSHCGRKIEAYSVGNVNEQILFCGAFNGTESITTYLLLKFLDDVCSSATTGGNLCDIKVDRFLKRRGIVVVPCVNPDGVEIASNGAVSSGRYENFVSNTSNGQTEKWQANANGVDINNNFNAKWEQLHMLEEQNEINGSAITMYGGRYAHSEPETMAIVDFCKSRNIRHAMAIHSEGEEIYWSFGEKTPPRAKIMANILSESSGYKLSEVQGFTLGGGFKDWFIHEFNRPAFKIEVGKGEKPLPISQKDEIYEKIKEMLTLSLIM